MGYVEIRPTVVKVVVNGEAYRFYVSKSNRGRFIGNLALALFDRAISIDSNSTTVILPPEGEKMFEEIVKNAQPSTSAGSIIRFILLTWDTIKKYGYNSKITLEELLRLYV
jgi:hypothetical protein